jgi:hypothetical protein
LPTNPVRGVGTVNSPAASSAEPAQQTASPGAGQHRSAAAAGLLHLGGTSGVARASSAQTTPRSGTLPPGPHELPRRPATPELSPANVRRPPLSIQQSAKHALAQTEVSERMAAKGIALHSQEVATDGQAMTRPSTVTPFLEEGRLEAERAALHLPTSSAMRFVAHGAGHQLRRLDAVDTHGRPLTHANGAARKLGEWLDPHDSRQQLKFTPVNEATAINRLARAYVTAIEADRAPESQRMNAQQRDSFVRRGPIASERVFQARLQKFVESLGNEGPRLAGLVMHAVARRADEQSHSSGRAGDLMEALLAAPWSLQQLIDAAHRDHREPEGQSGLMAGACAALSDAAAQAPYFSDERSGQSRRRHLRDALRDLRASAHGAHGPGLLWLLAQTPSPVVERAAWVDEMLNSFDAPDEVEPLRAEAPHSQPGEPARSRARLGPATPEPD